MQRPRPRWEQDRCGQRTARTQAVRCVGERKAAGAGGGVADSPLGPGGQEGSEEALALAGRAQLADTGVTAWSAMGVEEGGPWRPPVTPAERRSQGAGEAHPPQGLFEGELLDHLLREWMWGVGKGGVKDGPPPSVLAEATAGCAAIG